MRTSAAALDSVRAGLVSQYSAPKTLKQQRLGLAEALAPGDSRCLRCVLARASAWTVSSTVWAALYLDICYSC